jgi:hypothetical protein
VDWQIFTELAIDTDVSNPLSPHSLISMAHKRDLAYRYSELSTLFSILRSGDKTAIKAYFNNLKNQFNMNYKLTDEGLEVINTDLHEYREFLWDIEFEYYIKPIRQEKFHMDNVEKLKNYIHRVVYEGFAPSRTYAKKIQDAQDDTERMRAQRDMIAEATDWYVTRIHESAQSASTIPREIGVLSKSGLHSSSPETSI